MWSKGKDICGFCRETRRNWVTVFERLTAVPYVMEIQTTSDFSLSYSSVLHYQKHVKKEGNNVRIIQIGTCAMLTNKFKVTYNELNKSGWKILIWGFVNKNTWTKHTTSSAKLITQNDYVIDSQFGFPFHFVFNGGRNPEVGRRRCESGIALNCQEIQPTIKNRRCPLFTKKTFESFQFSPVSLFHHPLLSGGFFSKMVRKGNYTWLSDFVEHIG